MALILLTRIPHQCLLRWITTSQRSLDPHFTSRQRSRSSLRLSKAITRYVTVNQLLLALSRCSRNRMVELDLSMMVANLKGPV